MTKMKKLLNMLRMAISKNWGPNPSIMREAVLGIVRPAFTYASVCWGHAIHSNKRKRDLLRLDRLCLTSIALTSPSVPTRGLAVMYGIIPLEFQVQKIAMGTYLRLPGSFALGWESRGKGKNKIGHRYFWRNLTSSWGMTATESDRTVITAERGSFRICRDSFGGERKYSTHAQMNVYTDGSRTESGVGSGVAIFARGKVVVEGKFTLPDSSTVFQAEILAIKEGARLAFDLCREECSQYIKFFIDSRAAL